MIDVDRIHRGDMTARIVYDDDVLHPYDDYFEVQIVSWHPRYTLSTPGIETILDLPLEDHYPTVEDIARALRRTHGAEVLPLYLYDHSIQSVSTRSFVGRAHHAEWDSAQVGFAFLTRQDILDRFGGTRATAGKRAQAREYIEGAIDYLNMYLTGDVYGVVVEDADGIELDALWGIYGLDAARDAAHELLADALVDAA